MSSYGAGEIIIMIFIVLQYIAAVGAVILVIYGTKKFLDFSRSDFKIPVTNKSSRASDADRDQTISKLQEEVGNGRLTLNEFEERLESAQAATTLGELAQLTRDLPNESR